MAGPWLSARERSVVLAGALAVAAAAMVRALPALNAWRDAAIASARERVAEAERAGAGVAAASAVRDSLVRRRERLLKLTPLLVGSGSPPGAAAVLVARLSAAATVAGVELGDVDVQLDTAAGGNLYRVSARAAATGDVTAIVRLLVELEGEPPLLAVREWSVSGFGDAAPPHLPDRLRLEFRVEGVARRSGPGTRP